MTCFNQWGRKNSPETISHFKGIYVKSVSPDLHWNAPAGFRQGSPLVIPVHGRLFVADDRFDVHLRQGTAKFFKGFRRQLLVANDSLQHPSGHIGANVRQQRSILGRFLHSHGDRAGNPIITVRSRYPDLWLSLIHI